MIIICIILMVVLSLPLLAYPAVLMSNLMVWAAPPSETPLPPLHDISAKIVLWGSTAYPAVWLIALIGSIIFLAMSQAKIALTFQVGLLGYLLLLVVTAYVWYKVGG